MTDARPMVRCFASPPFVGAPIYLISIYQALRLKVGGWWIVGPDPIDMQDVARWDREHAKHR